jgi:DNA-binding MarR family transcriptional regulator
MADVKSGPNPLFLRDEELRQAIELLYFGYRAFTAEPDQILAQYGFGRAHHRVIYFVGRHPGITVSELLEVLQITKQSLSRVLRQLLREGFVAQRTGTRDRRQRLLELTEKGREMERMLTENQRRRIARAYQDAGPEAVEGFWKVMLNICNARDRKRFSRGRNDDAPPQRGAPAA